MSVSQYLTRCTITGATEKDETGRRRGKETVGLQTLQGSFLPLGCVSGLQPKMYTYLGTLGSVLLYIDIR